MLMLVVNPIWNRTSRMMLSWGIEAMIFLPHKMDLKHFMTWGWGDVHWNRCGNLHKLGYNPYAISISSGMPHHTFPVVVANDWTPKKNIKKNSQLCMNIAYPKFWSFWSSFSTARNTGSTLKRPSIPINQGSTICIAWFWSENPPLKLMIPKGWTATATSQSCDVSVALTQGLAKRVFHKIAMVHHHAINR